MSIIQFDPQQMAEIELFLDTLPELEGLAPAELEQMRDKVQSLIDRLDALEPKMRTAKPMMTGQTSTKTWRMCWMKSWICRTKNKRCP